MRTLTVKRKDCSPRNGKTERDILQEKAEEAGFDITKSITLMDDGIDDYYLEQWESPEETRAYYELPLTGVKGNKMKRILMCFLLLISFIGCGQLDSIMPVINIDVNIPFVSPVKPDPIVVVERPTVNLPYSLRQSNWLGRQREGSCTWATAISLLRWQGRYNTADWIRRNYGDGEWPEHYAQQLDAAGIRYAYTTDGNVDFLEWACETRRGCGVTVRGGRHMVTLVHLDKEWAALLDNNSVGQFIWVPRAAFIAEWKASHGWAVTTVYAPCPPLPPIG